MTAIRSTFMALILALTSCALFTTSPEEQIRTGANTVSSGAKLTTSRLANKKITPEQANNYRDMLRTGQAMLHTADKELVACRKETGSVSTTTPDPCKRGVILDIELATSILSEVEATLRAKEQQ